MKRALTVLFAQSLAVASSGVAQGTPRSYALRGTVRDSPTGRPVTGAQIWPGHTNWGVVSDADGRYELRWPYRSVQGFQIHVCGGPKLAEIAVDFWHDSITNRDIVIGRPQHGCPPDRRPPWAVDA